jgi:hypothetical protein
MRGSYRYFRGPYECPACGLAAETTLDLALHNEQTGHLNQIPVLKRVPQHAPIKVPDKPKVVRTVRVEVDGYIIEKRVLVDK